MKIKLENIFCFITGIVAFIFFAHTLNYPWKHFDEAIIYNETILPIPNSFSQIFDYIKYFGLSNYFEASNPFYTSISNLRCDPAATLIALFVYYFFQKSAFAYHAFSLVLHLFNTCILFLILNKVSLQYLKSNKIISKDYKLFLILILTLFWSLNPLNIETILFATNWVAVLSYSLCLFVVFYFVNFTLNKDSFLNFLTLFILFSIPLFSTEYSITLPLILFLYTYISYRFSRHDSSFIQAISHSFKKTSPLFLALLIFIFHFFIFPTKENITQLTQNSISIITQRIFWLSPQIFFHYVKLILFPIHLSIDQTAMVKFSRFLTEPYSLFCSAFFFGLISFLFLSLILIKRKLFFFFCSSFSYFLIALLPFLHIISPTYCLASERYLYFPLLMLVFGISHFIFFLLSRLSGSSKMRTCILIILVSSLGILAIRSYIRTIDWEDDASLFESSLNSTSNKLFKALRMSTLGNLYVNYYKDYDSQIKGKYYLNESIKTLEQYLIELEKDKQKHQDKLPEIIKVYGLDPKTIQAKIAYLLVISKIGSGLDIKSAYEILHLYMQDLSVIDTQILDLYLGTLFATNNLDEAERIINYVTRKKLTSNILIINSELYKRKYNDLIKAELLLRKSFKYFPYDVQTLESLRRFYLLTNKPNEFALFSYLYGIRAHSLRSLQEAYQVFLNLNNQTMAKRVYNSLTPPL